MSNQRKCFLIGAGALLISLFLSVGSVYAAETKIGTITDDFVNVRSDSSTESAILGQVFAGDRVTVISDADGWYQVALGEDTVGWIYSDFVSLSEVPADIGIINDSFVNFRSSPGFDGEVMDILDYGTELSVFERVGDWYKVQAGDMIGYVYADFVSVRSADISRGSRNMDLRSQVVAYAKRFLGTPYVYGGNTPDGFDCSGFTKYVMAQFGINLERVASDQALQGTWVSKEDLQPGDLVFFDTDGYGWINHVGIYIGGGQFIHASSGAMSMQVTITSLYEPFYINTYYTARNVLD